jgi:hypothetical protein
MIRQRASARVVGILVSAAMFAAACSGPFHVSDQHITSMPRLPSVDMAGLVCEPVAALGVVAPAGLQGLNPTVSHAFTIALEKGSPRFRVIPLPEVLNRLSDRGLAEEYAEGLAGYGRSGIPEREWLQRIGAAIDARYILLPGLGEFNHSLHDKFEIGGLKLVRTRVSILRLWLQVWDTKSGHILSESTGEATMSAPVINQDKTVALDDVAQSLWSRIIRDGLLAGNTDWSCRPGEGQPAVPAGPHRCVFSSRCLRRTRARSSRPTGRRPSASVSCGT